MRHFPVTSRLRSALLLPLALTTLLAVHAQAQSLNVATWMVELPEVPATSTNRSADLDPALRRVAGALKPLNADILILHGIPDRNAAKQLTGLLRPRVYHNPIHSTFRRTQQSPELVEPPITVLSRKQPASSRSVEWRTTGAIDAPGGFSIATFQIGTNTLFLYTVQFPKVLPGMNAQQEATVPRKRELSARYLLSHVNWLRESTTNGTSHAYLATDLELDGDGSATDPALAVLRAGGLVPSSGSRTLVASTALAATGWPPEGALVSAFVGGTEFPGDPESITRRSFFAPIALLELDLVNGATRAAATLAAKGARTSDTNQPPAALALATPALGSSLVPWAQDRTLLIGVGSVAVLLGLCAWYWRRRSHQTLMALVPAQPRGDATPGLSGGSRLALPSQGVAARLRVVDTPTGRSASAPAHSENQPEAQDPRTSSRHGFAGAHEGPEAGAERGPGEDATGSSRSSQWPFLHLLRERLVRWLADERSQLLSSHHAGAEQVLELEERLTRIQNQFETRLRAREERITALEAELMSKERRIADLQQTGPNQTASH